MIPNCSESAAHLWPCRTVPQGWLLLWGLHLACRQRQARQETVEEASREREDLKRQGGAGYLQECVNCASLGCGRASVPDMFWTLVALILPGCWLHAQFQCFSLGPSFATGNGELH